MIIALFGDIMVAGPTAASVKQDGPEGLARALRELIAPAELVVGNFEVMICADGVEPGSEWYGPPESAAVVAEAGFDAVSLATNHTWDHGQKAVEDTIALLAQQNIDVFGLGDKLGNPPEPIICRRGSFAVGLIGYATASTMTKRKSYTGIAPSRSRMRRDIGRVRRESDVVIVSIHHGDSEYPSPELRKWARWAVEEGADIVTVHHSHQIAGVQAIGNGVAAYGLANCVGSFGRNPQRANICLKAEIRDRKVVRWWYEPFFTDERGYPCRGSESEQGQIRQRMEELSRDLTKEDYDKFYWSQFGSGNRATFLRSWKRDLRTYGLSTIWAKLMRLRMHQLKILFRVLFRH